MTEQTTISDGEPTMGKDPKDNPCEWCGEQSTVRVEREKKISGKNNSFVKTGMFMYACDNHRRVAEDNRIMQKKR